MFPELYSFYYSDVVWVCVCFGAIFSCLVSVRDKKAKIEEQHTEAAMCGSKKRAALIQLKNMKKTCHRYFSVVLTVSILLTLYIFKYHEQYCAT